MNLSKCSHPGNLNPSQGICNFTITPESALTILPSRSPNPPLQRRSLFWFVSHPRLVFAFWQLHINGNIQCGVLGGQLLELSTMLLWLVPVVVGVSVHPFLLLRSVPLMHLPQLVHLFFYGWISLRFPVWVIMNKTAMNSFVEVLSWTHTFVSLGWMCGRELQGGVFYLWERTRTFPKCLYLLQSHHWYESSGCSTSCANLAMSVFILVDTWWRFLVFIHIHLYSWILYCLAVHELYVSGLIL